MDYMKVKLFYLIIIFFVSCNSNISNTNITLFQKHKDKYYSLIDYLQSNQSILFNSKCNRNIEICIIDYDNLNNKLCYNDSIKAKVNDYFDNKLLESLVLYNNGNIEINLASSYNKILQVENQYYLLYSLQNYNAIPSNAILLSENFYYIERSEPMY